MNNNQKKNSDKRSRFSKVENYIKISFFIALFIFGVAGTMVDNKSNLPTVITACSATWMFASITFHIILIGVIQDSIDEIVDEYLRGEEEWFETLGEED